MRILIFFVMISVFLTSCNKDKHTSKKLNGDWELILLKMTLDNGISEYPVSNGNLKISENQNDQGNNSFQSDLYFELNGIDHTEIKSGFLQLRDNGGYMNATIIDGSNTQIAIEDQRIMVLTSTDLQIEYSDEQGRLRSLTYRKKKN